MMMIMMMMMMMMIGIHHVNADDVNYLPIAIAMVDCLVTMI